MSTFREEFISLIEAPAVRRVLEDLDLLGQAESANLVTRFVGINPADYRPFDVVVISPDVKLPDVC